jgi:RNA polymerase sigma factor (sigma-70 family)
LVDIRDEELYGKHADELIRFATTLVGPSVAEDVVANAVVRSMTSPAWPTVAEPRAYLFRAVLNEARGVGRSDRRRARREKLASRDEIFDEPKISVEVSDAMSRLSLRQRSVLFLAYWQDLSVGEIAETLGLSRRSTERALTDARRTLEEHLT